VGGIDACFVGKKTMGPQKEVPKRGGQNLKKRPGFIGFFKRVKILKKSQTASSTTGGWNERAGEDLGDRTEIIKYVHQDIEDYQKIKRKPAWRGWGTTIFEECKNISTSNKKTAK